MNFPKISGLFLELGTAFVLLTRLPMPRLPDAAFERSAQAVWAYGIVGGVLGALAALFGVIAIAAGAPAPVAAGIVLVILIVSAGAMHEDGLADTADGFWGAQSADKRLAIMKDSQIGSYGTLSLILVTGLRWSAISVLLTSAPAAVIAGAALSRAAMPLVMHRLPPARSAGLSQGVGQPAFSVTLAALALGFAIAYSAVGSAALLSILLCVMISGACIFVADRKIKGQTGDVLGATQQLCEVATLCFLASVFA